MKYYKLNVLALLLVTMLTQSGAFAADEKPKTREMVIQEQPKTREMVIEEKPKTREMIIQEQSNKPQEVPSKNKDLIKTEKDQLNDTQIEEELRKFENENTLNSGEAKEPAEVEPRKDENQDNIAAENDPSNKTELENELGDLNKGNTELREEMAGHDGAGGQGEAALGGADREASGAHREHD